MGTAGQDMVSNNLTCQQREDNRHGNTNRSREREIRKANAEGFVLTYLDGHGGKDYGSKLYFDLNDAQQMARDSEDLGVDITVTVECNEHRTRQRSGSCHYCAMLQEAPSE